MNEQIKQAILSNLSAVITALNKVTVHGKENCLNLAGSIDTLEGITITIQNVAIEPMIQDNGEPARPQ